MLEHVVGTLSSRASPMYALNENMDRLLGVLQYTMNSVM